MISPEKTSPAGPLGRLARLNVTAVFLAVLAYTLLGLFVPGAVGGVLLLLLAGGLVWLMAQTWPVQSPGSRVIRLTMLMALIGMALLKIL